jgi:hypothetical protein
MPYMRVDCGTKPRHALIAMPLIFIFIFFLQFFLIVHSAIAETAEQVALTTFFNRNATVITSESAHTNNWAVLVCASRYWFNYRVRSIAPHHMQFAHPEIADR